MIGGHQLSWGTDFPQKEVLPRVQTLQKLNCGAFEAFLSGSVPASAIRKATKEVGLIPVGCAVIRPRIDGDPLAIDGRFRYPIIEAMKRYVSLVHDIGGSLLVGPLANVLAKTDAHFPSERELQEGVDTFRKVAKFAAKKDVRVAIEFLQESEIPWPTTARQVIEFIRRVEQACGIKGILGVLFDVYHANRMEENLYEALREVLEAGLLFHMHVAGPRRTPPRIEQHIDWKRIVSTLIKADWEGIITIESFGAECDLPPAVVGFGKRLPAEEVIATGVATLKKAGL